MYNGPYSIYKGQNSTLMHPSSYRWNQNSTKTFSYVNRKIRSSCSNSFICCVQLRESRYNWQVAGPSCCQDPLKAHDQFFVLIFKFIFSYESSGFCSSVIEVSLLLGYDAALLGIWFPKFRDNVLVASSRVEMSKVQSQQTSFKDNWFTYLCWTERHDGKPC
jgi:hypothetical protein